MVTTVREIKKELEYLFEGINACGRFGHDNQMTVPEKVMYCFQQLQEDKLKHQIGFIDAESFLLLNISHANDFLDAFLTDAMELPLFTIATRSKNNTIMEYLAEYLTMEEADRLTALLETEQIGIDVDSISMDEAEEILYGLLSDFLLDYMDKEPLFM